ncbi:unnamed protein product [Sphagnum tenellum]
MPGADEGEKLKQGDPGVLQESSEAESPAQQESHGANGGRMDTGLSLGGSHSTFRNRVGGEVGASRKQEPISQHSSFASSGRKKRYTKLNFTILASSGANKNLSLGREKEDDFQGSPEKDVVRETGLFGSKAARNHLSYA